MPLGAGCAMTTGAAACACAKAPIVKRAPRFVGCRVLPKLPRWLHPRAHATDTHQRALSWSADGALRHAVDALTKRRTLKQYAKAPRA